MDYEIRPITADEVQDFRGKLMRGFGDDLKEDDENGRDRFLAIMPLERTLAAFDSGEIIGTLGDFPLQLTVPGGELAMAGTTMITVQATHRRRGVLRAMLDSHLSRVREAGEPLAGLWASESSIYGRFGFGLASDRHSVDMDTTAVRFNDEALEGSVRLIDAAEAAKVLPAIFDRLRRSRPGMLGRSPEVWKWRILHDPAGERHGSSALRVVVHTGPDGDDGYALYRQKEKWEEFFSKGTVNVREVIAPTVAGHADLWRFLTNVDLFPRLTYWNLPVDDELPWRITDPRRVTRSVWDALWIRPIDICAALAGRSYAIDGRLSLNIVDGYFPDNDGTYEIEVTNGIAECVRTSGEADVSLSASALGALFLGGRKLGALTRAGHVHGTAKAIRLADSFFGWDPAPWCQEVF